eukprot:m.239252 g.239252  ORF g.239252 m.239252 type:complete len:117 (+) comp16064_c0_seq10:279-629(+)
MLCTPRRILLILLSSLALGYIISHLHSNSHRSSKQLKAKRDVLLPTHIYSSKGVVNGNEEERLYEEIQKEFENDVHTIQARLTLVKLNMIGRATVSKVKKRALSSQYGGDSKSKRM